MAYTVVIRRSETLPFAFDIYNPTCEIIDLWNKITQLCMIYEHIGELFSGGSTTNTVMTQQHFDIYSEFVTHMYQLYAILGLWPNDADIRYLTPGLLHYRTRECMPKSFGFYAESIYRFHTECNIIST